MSQHISELNFAYKKQCSLGYDEAVQRIKAELKEEGFGILSELDIQEKLQEKLGEKFRRYVILGACNPQLAFEALQQEPDIGVMLPCNVVVYEEGDGSCVLVVRPGNIAAGAHNEAVDAVAAEADLKLRSAIERLN